MTYAQRNLAAREAANYTDPDAFVSDLPLLSAFLPDGEEAGPDMTLEPELRRLWHILQDPFGDFLRGLGMTATQAAERFCIPYRTVKKWCTGGVDHREAAPYIRLMMADIGQNEENMDKDMMDIMVQDWLADHAPECDTLVFDGDAYCDSDGQWVQPCHDGKTDYYLVACSGGNIELHYGGTR